MTARIEMRGVSKSFPGVRALDHVDFRVEAGEVHALMGENGAGKSTLIKIMTGALGRDEGEIRIDGRRVEIGSPGDLTSTGWPSIRISPSSRLIAPVMILMRVDLPAPFSPISA